MSTPAGKLEGRVALVTGAGRGIGQALAGKFAREGARMVVNDLDADAVEETLHLVKEQGGEAVGCVGSVTEDGFADRFVAQAVESFGGIDIIVNGAGYTWDSVIQKMTDEQWNDILAVHLTAPFRILRAAQPVISAQVKKEATEGRVVHRKVVNVSSLAGVGGNAGQANYSAAKAGLIGLTKTLAKEWGRYHVNVNAVAFGLVHTRLTDATADAGASINIGDKAIKVGVNPELRAAMEQMIPLGRGGTPEEAAGAIYLLCTPEADYISGEFLICAGGMQI